MISRSAGKMDVIGALLVLGALTGCSAQCDAKSCTFYRFRPVELRAQYLGDQVTGGNSIAHMPCYSPSENAAKPTNPECLLGTSDPNTDDPHIRLGCDSVQLSELSLYQPDGARVNPVNVIDEACYMVPHEKPESAFDGDTSTKWLDFSFGALTFEVAPGTTVAKYSFTTANDFPGRDPITWVLEGGTDGTTWTVLDVRTKEPQTDAVPSQRFTETSHFTLTDIGIINDQDLNITLQQAVFEEGTEGDECESNGECKEGEYCANGWCWHDGSHEEGKQCVHDRECDGYCEKGTCWDGSPKHFCGDDDDCQRHLVCRDLFVGGQDKRCDFPRPERAMCARNSWCQGYCQNLRCWDGSEGDDCGEDSDCQDDLTCIGALFFKKCRKKKDDGGICGTDDDCKGYCHNLRCWDGSEGDDCNEDSECQDGLTCIGAFAEKECKKPKNEGAVCGSDNDCKGYCHNLRCWDGSRGDDCGTNSDCQGNMACAGFPIKKCTDKKGEGATCNSDNDCIGYCELRKCYDGSRGDRCGSDADCQGRLKCKRRTKCGFLGICWPVEAFRTCR